MRRFVEMYRSSPVPFIIERIRHSLNALFQPIRAVSRPAEADARRVTFAGAMLLIMRLRAIYRFYIDGLFNLAVPAAAEDELVRFKRAEIWAVIYQPTSDIVSPIYFATE